MGDDGSELRQRIAELERAHTRILDEFGDATIKWRVELTRVNRERDRALAAVRELREGLNTIAADSVDNGIVVLAKALLVRTASFAAPVCPFCGGVPHLEGVHCDQFSY